MKRKPRTASDWIGLLLFVAVAAGAAVDGAAGDFVQA
jgi:hypothetical protein